MCILKLAIILHAHCKFVLTALFDREYSLVTDITQSTCQVNFNTIYNQPSTSIQLVTSTSQASTMVTLITTIKATFGVTSTTDSAPLVIIVLSITSGIIGLCIVFICIIGLIVKKKQKRNNVRRSIFTFQPLTSTFKRYSCVYVDQIAIAIYIMDEYVYLHS